MSVVCYCASQSSYSPTDIHCGASTRHLCCFFRFTASQRGTSTGMEGLKGPKSPCSMCEINAWVDCSPRKLVTNWNEAYPTLWKVRNNGDFFFFRQELELFRVHRLFHSLQKPTFTRYLGGYQFENCCRSGGELRKFVVTALDYGKFPKGVFWVE